MTRIIFEFRSFFPLFPSASILILCVICVRMEDVNAKTTTVLWYINHLYKTRCVNIRPPVCYSLQKKRNWRTRVDGFVSDTSDYMARYYNYVQQ